jgi:archaellin
MKLKAMVGIGTLIVFISAILVAAVGAGVILYTQNRLQIEALKAGSYTREAIGTSLLIESVQLTNVQNTRGENFLLRAKLGPGSSPINLNKTIVSVVTKDAGTSLVYGGVGDDIYFTNKVSREIKDAVGDSYVRLRTDLDNDLVEDYFKVHNSTTLIFNLSSTGLVYVNIPDISIIGAEIDYIANIGNLNSQIIIKGTISVPNVLVNMEVKIIPEEVGKGIYSITYSIRGGRDVENALLFGDMIRVYFETSSSVSEGERISISYMTSNAVVYTKEIATPHVMTSSNIQLFP